jgi:protein O-GlcNAc transferase
MSKTSALKARTILLQQAAALHRQGSLAEAETRYREVLAAEPDNIDALNLLGVVTAQRGDAAEARRLIGRAVQLKPDFAHALLNLAALQRTAGDRIGAAETIERALRFLPEDIEALVSLGQLYYEMDRAEDAIVRLQAALALAPEHPAAIQGLVLAFWRLRRSEEAIGVLDRSRSLSLADRQAVLDLAVLTHSGDDPDTTHSAGTRVASAQPGNLAAQAILASACLAVADFSGAETVIERIKALAARPMGAESAGAAMSLAYFMPQLGLSSHFRQKLQPAIDAKFSRWTAMPKPSRSARHRDGRIRVGYLSADFAAHAASDGLGALLAAHDRSKFEIFAYASGGDSGELTAVQARLRRGAEHWLNIRPLDHRQAAERIAADGIDVLVELNGYMRGARLEVLAQRPAPVQVHWLGHGSGLGLSFFDYVIADRMTVRDGDQAHFREAVVRLPHFYAPAGRLAITDTGLTRAQLGLRPEGIVFCAFSNTNKIDRSAFASWMRILGQVPHSQLWLSNPLDSRTLQVNLRREAAGFGIEADRLIFAAPIADKAAGLGRYRLADLFLDTFRFNAATTSLEALWTGLPLVTLEGQNFASRIGASALTALGLTELICQTPAEFEARVVALARAPSAIAALRSHLEAVRGSAPPFDPAGFARDLETAFAQMVDRALGGDEPECFDVARTRPDPAGAT